MDKAEQSCRQLLQTYPQSLIVLNVLGAALQRQGQLLPVVQVFDQMIQLKPNLAYNRGVALKKLGQLEATMDSYNQAIQLKPDFTEAYSNRGNVLTELGQLGGAVENHDKAIGLKPDYAEASWLSNSNRIMPKLTVIAAMH